MPITISRSSFDPRPFRGLPDVSRLPTLDLPDMVLFPGESVTLAVTPTDPLARLVEQAGGRSSPDLPGSRVFKFRCRFDPPAHGDAGVPGRVCTLGTAAGFPEPSLVTLRLLARAVGDQGGASPGPNPAYPVFGRCADYQGVRDNFVKLLERSPGTDAVAAADLLDVLEAIELGRGRDRDGSASPSGDSTSAKSWQAPTLPIDVAADFIAVSLIRRIADLDVPVPLQQRWLDILNPDERVRALNAFMVDVLEGAGPEKTYERGLKAREEHWRQASERRRDDSLGGRLLKTRLDDVQAQLEDPTKRLRGRIEACGMPREVLNRLRPELDKLSADTAEKVREYFLVLADLPWRGGGPETIDVERARSVLNERHVGLRDAKKRILEHLAVRRRKGDARGQILCFVGPPGVGKTSLAAGVARALGRRFAEMSCNSLTEVADVRGARRDYAASHPGAIIRQLQRIGARNPVFLLDEIDKVGWAPGMALLDALDPTRNAAFHDLYVDLPFDLSEVFFIATANVLGDIPAVLRDRVEAIEIAGYTVEEKFEIAKRILVPARIRDHGLTGGLIAFEDEALRGMIRDHANKMGVRDLDRGVSAICRRTALRLEASSGGAAETTAVTADTVREVLGAGKGGGEVLPGVEGIRAAIDRGGLPDAARRHAKRELQLMLSRSPGDADYGDRFTYLQCLTGLPWNARREEPIDQQRARELLDEGHWGLAKAKARLLEDLAVRRLGGNPRTVLCLVGPPGVGKTSLAQGIAGAMGRKFAKISCAGMSDGTELRGHNRTWRAAQAGRLVREFARIGSKNPVLLLDEVDKISRVSNSGGDPESALLEVLDPEQNEKFVDNYVEVPFDLSETCFVATANEWGRIAAPLRDRLEKIELPGYSEDEKLEIARAHLVGRQLEENGLAAAGVRFTDGALHALIRGYTREAGVRELGRRIGAVCRKVALRRAAGDESPVEVTEPTVADMLGRPPHADEAPSGRMKRPGVAMGLSWTPAGGDVLFVEASRMSGGGALTLTGQLGGVMKESAHAALAWVRANAARHGVDPGFYEAAEVHLHVPAGGIPKDGPSAGVAMVAALVSALTGRAVRRDIAMTGEITLSGDVIKVGGVKEKVLAARRLGLAGVILPNANATEVDEKLGEDLLRGIDVRFVSTIDEMLARALAPPTA